MQIKITNGTFGFGGETLFENVNFEVNTGDKIAIIGKNGSGKTTLLKILTGEIELHQEDNMPPVFSIVGKPTISSLKQMTFDNENISLWDEMLKCYEKIIKIENKLQKIQEKLENNYSESLINEFSSLHDQFEMLGGYSYSAELNKALSSFGFSEDDKGKNLNQFSGGQKTKIAFIKLVLSKPDLLLLDEPTNHLDIRAVTWLEEYISLYKGAVLIVSHDRTFLDNTVNTIYEIEYKKLTKYIGNYSKFIETKNANYEQNLKKYEAQQREIADINEFIERFRYKATKANAVQSRIKYLEKLEIIPPPQKADGRPFHTKINPNVVSGTDVLTCNKLVIGYSNLNPLATIDFKIQRGDRLGIIGGNGLGKSTFLQTIMGKIEPISGHFKFGFNVEPAYFEQLSSKYDSKTTIFDEFQKAFPDLSSNDIRTSLGAFLFSGKDVLKEMKTLSGGELVRFELAKIFEKKPNLLILDEPTNHMDIISKETLENILLNYTGTIIFVSHDRYFIQKIATKLLVFTENSAQFFNGTYTEFSEPYTRQVKDLNKALFEEKPEKIEYPENYGEPDSDDEIKTMSPYLASKEKNKLKARIAKIEENSAKLEENLKKLNENFVNPEIASDFKKLMEIQAEIERTQISVDKLADEWTEKTEFLSKLETYFDDKNNQ